MSLSRPSRSFLPTAIALALGLATVPFAGVATAVTPAVTAYDIPFHVIGPNAGFPGNTDVFPESIDMGVSGRTPLAVIKVDSGTSLTSAKIRLFDLDDFSGRFDATDGFALFKDTNSDGKFRSVDFDAGPVSSSFTPDFSTGFIDVTVTAAGTATGSETYFLTAHPKASGSPNQTFTAAVRSGSVVTSAGNIPSSDVSVPLVTIDSVAPAPPTASNFTLTVKKPTDADVEDFYTVAVAELTGRSNERFAFFNTTGSTASANLLTRPGDTPAVWDAKSTTTPATPVVMKVGNGTGRVTSGSNPVLTALNNQKDDTVHVAAFDAAGNLTSTVALATNDVTAPTYTTYTVAVPQFINTTNYGVSPNGAGQITVTGTLTGAAGIASQSSRLYLRGEDGQPVEGTITDYVSTAATSQTSVPTNGNDASDFAQNALIHADAYSIDAAGNATDVISTTAPGLKDTIKPKIKAISLTSDGGSPNQLDPNDQVLVTFEEDMDQTKIKDDNLAGTECNPGALPQATGTGADANCVNNRILGVFATNTARPIFGTNPGFDWLDSRSALIKIGAAPTAPTSVTDCDAPDPVGARCVRMLTISDKVKLDATVLDLHANPADIAAEKAFSPVQPLPLKAETADDLGGPKFNQGDNRDGVLDSITVTWSSPITSFAADEDSFSINSGGDVLTPSSIVVGASTVKLNFTPEAGHEALWQSGARPTVFILANKTDGQCDTSPCTGLQNNSGVDVPELNVISADKAKPSVMSVKTGDNDADGHIDRLVVQYSEAIRHDLENPCGYTTPTTAYMDAAAPTTCFNNARLAFTGTGSSSQTVLTLKEQSAFDTDVRPAVTFNQNDPTPITGGNKPITDEFGNTLTGWNDVTGVNVTIDGAGPVIVERRAKDNDADGQLDRIEVQYSENVKATTIGFAKTQMTVSEPTRGVTDVKSIDSKTIELWIEEGAAAGTGDTGLKPKVAYTPGTEGAVTDVNATGPDNPAPAQAAADSLDKAAPAIVAATFNYSGAIDTTGAPTPADSGLKMKVVFSEPVAASPDKTKFEMTQGERTAAPTDVAAQGQAADTFRIFTFAGPAYDLFAGGTIRMTALETVEDAAAGGANKSKQLTAVPYFGYPTARLNFSGPAGSFDGYSTSKTFNTGAAGAAAVKWMLVVQSANSPAPPPPTGPDDAQFKDTQPVTATVETDGAYKGYLWTRDAVGNITHKDLTAAGQPVAEDTITVASTAPDIRNAQFINATSNSTKLRAGDTIRVVADGYGPDSQQWASNGACLPQYMSVDYRGVTGLSNKGQVAPTSCQYFPTSSPPHRHMEFPFVVANRVENYPVGTALRTGGSTDPGYIIEDGASGVVKRRFHSLTARRSWGIRDGEVIRVPAAVLAQYPTGKVKYYRDGAIVRPAGFSAYYVIDNGVRRGVTSNFFRYYRYNWKMVYVVPASELSGVPRATNVSASTHPLGSYVRTSTGNVYVILKAPNGKLYRRHVIHSFALATLVPSTHVLTANSADVALPMDVYKRGYRDGVMLRKSVGNNLYEYYVISRGNPRKFLSSDLFKSMGFNTTNARTFASYAIGRLSSASTFTNGLGLNYYNISIQITVRNVAGLADPTPPVITVQGRGTPEPKPAALPTSVPARP